MSFDDLPNELLFMIHHEIGDDLLAHVCFMKLCLRTATLYHNFDGEFWQRLCGRSGLGRLAHEHAHSNLYERIAVECAEHAWACDHPHCGPACISENEQKMRELCEEIIQLSPMQLLNNESIKNLLSPNDIFCLMEFDEGYTYDNPFFTYFCTPDDVLYGVQEENILEAHPVVMRSFATFPPCDTMQFLPFNNIPAATNSSGVTVGEVISSVKTVLAERPTTEDIVVWLRENVSGDSNEIFPKTWSIVDVFESVASVLGWFEVVKWTGFSLKYDVGVGLNFDFLFEPRHIHPSD